MLKNVLFWFDHFEKLNFARVTPAWHITEIGLGNFHNDSETQGPLLKLKIVTKQTTWQREVYWMDIFDGIVNSRLMQLSRIVEKRLHRGAIIIVSAWINPPDEMLEKGVFWDSQTKSGWTILSLEYLLVFAWSKLSKMKASKLTYQSAISRNNEYFSPEN